MSNGKSTPGPWKGSGYEGIYECEGRKMISVCADDKLICVFARHEKDGQYIYGNDDIANANLIAAAPDLLAACKKTRAMFDNTIQLYDVDLAEFNAAVDALEAAIAKAERKVQP